MKKFYFLILSVLFTLPIVAQQTITGTVTSSEDELPVIGVSVVVKGTSYGVSTNLDGVYSLSASKGQTLVFTYVGMKSQEIKVGDSNVIDVVMESTSEQLEEVVVTAMGVRTEKRKLNYAAQSLSGESITAGQSANFVNSLQGKVAGVNVTSAGGSPNSGSQIIIRGISSINPNQNNEPLFIIDGMQITGGGSKAADINPNDIENVTVLKGAAASALYGQLGANGVIMITTKNGQVGKVSVNVNASLQADQALRTPKLQSIYGPGAAGFHKEQTTGGWGPLIGNDETVYDNVGDFLGTGIYQKYDVSASGATEKFGAYASASYTNSQGLVPNDYLTKTGVILKANYALGSQLTINVMLNMVNSKSRGFGNSMSQIYNWPINDRMSHYKNDDESIRWLYLSDNKHESPVNPYWKRYEDSGENQTTRNLMQGSLTWKPVKKLEITGRLNYDQTNSSNISYTTPRFTRMDFTDKELEAVGDNTDIFGTFSYAQSKSELLTAQALATYQIKISDDFSIDLLAGAELRTLNSLEPSLGGRDFTIPGEFYSQQNVREVLNGRDVSLYRRKTNMYSYYGEVKFDYKGIAQLGITERNDNSSTVDPDKRSYFYPSFSAGVIFTELFAVKSNIFNYGKLRGNWAKVGKDARPYLFDKKFRQYPAYPDGGYAADPTASVAKNIQPEMATSWEIGADLRFFNNKTRIDLAYYSTLVENQIVSVRVPVPTGDILQTRNEGSIKNHGLELSLDQDLIKTRDLSWSANLNFGMNRGKVIFLPDQLVELQGTQYGDIFPVAYLNGPTTGISGKDYERTPDGKIICDENGYPIISAAKGNLIGNREPDFLLGFSSYLNYKDFSFSFLLDTRKGGDVMNVTSRGLYSSGQHKNLEFWRNREIIFDGVVANGDGTYSPNQKPIILDSKTISEKFVGVSSNFIEDGSYIRLSYVTLGYDLSKLIKSTAIKGMKVSLTGRNLFLLTRYSGSDPQINASTASGGTGSMGIDNYAVPSTRSINFNLNLTF